MIKKTYIYLITIITCCLLTSNSKDTIYQEVSQREDTISEIINLVFAGDIMGHMPQIKAAYDSSTNSFDFRPCYTYIKPYISSADLAIANLEVPLAGKPYSGYPAFSSPDELFYGAVDAGFDITLLANNHAADKGKLGISRTIKTVSQKTKFAGAYYDKQQRDSIYPLLVNVKGVKLAFLNCSYSTNGYPVPSPFIVNRIDTAQIRIDIQNAKKKNADLIIMCIHWGEEYKNKANLEQKNLAKAFAHMGVDLIIGSHPHVVQNFEYIYRSDSTKVPVYYSLGNTISNQRERYKNGGILARVQVNVKTKKIDKCAYTPFYVYKGEIHGKYQYYLVPTTQYLNSVFDFKLPEIAENSLKIFDIDTRTNLFNISVLD